jgi:hypothetical protein
MTADKVLAVLTEYRTILKSWRAKPVRDTGYILKGEPLDPTGRRLNHLAWMVEETYNIVNTGKLEKAFRWLGFIQGGLWCHGIRSIDQMREDNKPAEEAFRPRIGDEP